MNNYHQYLQSEEWGIKRQKALDFWDNKCVLCYSDKDLHVHHRTYHRLGNEKLTDLVVMCKKCHGIHHHEMGVNEKMKLFWNNILADISIEELTWHVGE